MSYGEMSPADIAAVSGGNGFGGWGNGEWWIILLFLFAFNGNWGGGVGAQPNYTLVSDFAQVESKLDSISHGICDGFYTNAQLSNSLGMNMMQSANAIQAQLADCCCKTQTAIGEVKYGAAINARDMMENQNANTRAILDAIAANRLEDKNAQIAAQQQKIFQLELASSQAAQNNYLVNQLRPCPTPAYITCNPWAGSAYGGCTTCGI